ncbi:MAG: 4Fe-4S binding protein [Anaerovoracaceae bacterium]
MRVNKDLCRGCKMCVRYCKVGAISMKDGFAVIEDNCVGCQICISACTFGAIEFE